MNVLLMGLRGCGKTTIGLRLAELLHRSFLDLDDVTLARLGETSVTEAWRRHGEAAWRAVEALALEDALQFDDHIIALGGGTVIVAEAVRSLRAAQAAQRAIAVYLQCTPEVLAERLKREPGDRPSLTGQGVAEEVERMLAQREPVYMELADLRLDADGDAAAVAATILKKLERLRP